MCLSAADHDPPVVFLDDMDIQIRIGLLMGRQVPVSLHIRHGPVHREVLILDHSQEFDEPIVVFCPHLPIHFECHAVHGVHGVHSYAPLETGPGPLPQQTLHLDLFHQVFRALVQMGEAVDLLSRQMGRGRQQVFAFGIPGQGVGRLYAVQGRPDDGMVHGVLHQFPHQIDLEFHLAQTLFILPGRFERHVGNSLF